MSHQSSSVGQTPARQGQSLLVDPGAQTCILVYFFWGYNPHWSVDVQSRFATCAQDYIGERFNLWLGPQEILKYYNNIPAAMKQAGRSHEWDEDLLGVCIAQLIQDEKEFDVVTDLWEDPKKELSEEALKFITKARVEMDNDGRMDKVKAVWAAGVSQIKEYEKKTSKKPAPFGSPIRLPQFKGFPKNALPNITFRAQLYLQSKEDLED